jgi:hypothetical protein
MMQLNLYVAKILLDLSLICHHLIAAALMHMIQVNIFAVKESVIQVEPFSSIHYQTSLILNVVVQEYLIITPKFVVLIQVKTRKVILILTSQILNLQVVVME